MTRDLMDPVIYIHSGGSCVISAKAYIHGSKSSWADHLKLRRTGQQFIDNPLQSSASI